MIVGQTRGWGICRNLELNSRPGQECWGSRVGLPTASETFDFLGVSLTGPSAEFCSTSVALPLHILLSTVRGLLSGLALGPSVTSCIMLHILTAHRTMLFL